MKIGKRFRFEAAHRLEEWPATHKCHYMHGHSYQVEVALQGPVDRFGDGAVVDFAEVTTWWKQNIFPLFDHKVLNDVLHVKNTTAEYIAEYIASNLRGWHFSRPTIRVIHVRVWETEDSYAEFTP